MNVFMNGIEALRSASERRLELLIKSGMSPEGVTMEVRDSGPGLVPRMADQLEEPFLATKPGGMGLGVPISPFIMGSHGGRLFRVLPSQGVLFQFILPVDRNDDA
jgi:two-component system, LuxR family, sensor kinase FixL